MTIDYRIRNLVIAVALAAAAVLLTVIYVTTSRNDRTTASESLTVYVPTKDFAAGTPGASVAASLQAQTVQRRNAPPQAVTSPKQVQGLYLTQPVFAGEQLTLRRFAPPSEQGIRTQLQGTLRAIQVPGTVHQLLVGTAIAGDRVDVVASLKNPKDSSEVKTSVVLRNLLVLQTESPAGGNGSRLQRADVGEHSLILGVTDAQAQRLYYVMKNGDWSLELRPVTRPRDSRRSTDTYATVLAGGGR